MARHIAANGEDEQGFGLEFVGHHDRALDQFLARAGQFGPFVEVGAEAAFDAPGNLVAHLHAF